MIQQCNARAICIFSLYRMSQRHPVYLQNTANSSNVKNYIAVVGRKRDDLDDKADYGEKLVIRCVQHGLSTCG